MATHVDSSTRVKLHAHKVQLPYHRGVTPMVIVSEVVPVAVATLVAAVVVPWSLAHTCRYYLEGTQLYRRRTSRSSRNYV